MYSIDKMNNPEQLVENFFSFLNNRVLFKNYLKSNNENPAKAFEFDYTRLNKKSKKGGMYMGITLNQIFKGLNLTLGPSIARILGFPIDDFQVLHFSQSGQYYFNNKIDLDANRPSLFYVYNNLVDPSLIGDSLAPSLRSVVLPPLGKEKYASITFSPINYYPMSLKSFNIVETELRSQNGDKIMFDYGVVNVILHCRRNRKRAI